MQHTRDQKMEQCIKNCEQCHHICMETMTHCLKLGSKHAAPDHILLLQDCIQICQTSADFMLRGSARHRYTCAACSEICEQCADDCTRLDPNDSMMKQCAEMCRRCADSCRQMAAAATA